MLHALKTVVMEPEKADVDAEVSKVCDFYSVNDGRLLSERTILASLVEQGARKLSNNALSSTPKFFQWLHEDGIMKILPGVFLTWPKHLVQFLPHLAVLSDHFLPFEESRRTSVLQWDSRGFLTLQF